MVCKNCGKEIDKKAAVCVHCGCAVKGKKSILKKWWFWVILAVVVIAVANSGGDGETTTGTGAEKVEIVYEQVELQSMFDDLRDNAMKAEEKYQKKHIEFTGKISNFDSDGSYISVEPTNADMWNLDSIMCYIKNEEQKQVIMEKSKGDVVTIKGKVKNIGEVFGYSLDITEIK